MSWRPAHSPAADSRRFDLTQLLPPFAPTHPEVGWLYSLARGGMKPGLARIEALLERVGNPHLGLRSVVVAGTNGKGSAATYLAALAAGSGLRVGLYTSPHLLGPAERIVVAGAAIPAAELVELIAHCRPHVEATEATFFEAITAVALLYFARERVELAVLETGLGGRLDATNAAGARAALLTSVGDDHHQILGDSLAAIAGEKLGLAREGMPFYVGELPAELRELARLQLEAAGAEQVDLSRARGVVAGPLGPPTVVELSFGTHRLRARLAQRGRMQAQSAALAAACWTDLAPRLGLAIGDVARSLERARAVCRYDVYGRDPELLLDTAHNAPALACVLEQWTSERPRAERLLVFGLMRDKRVEAVLPAIAGAAAEVIVTAPRWERSLEPRELAQRLREAAPPPMVPAIAVYDQVTGALEHARRRALAMRAAGGRPSVLVTGSNFLVAEVLDRLGVDDLLATEHSPLLDAGLALRDRPEREVASPWTG